MLFHALTKRLTYANVTSTVCLFILLGGSAYAAVKVTGKDVKDGSLTSADIKDHSLRARDFRAGVLRAGATGPRGAQGEPGRDGAKGDPGPGTATAPAIDSRRPAGRLTLPGIAGDGPGGAIEVRSIAWSNTLSGTVFGGGGGGGAKAVWGDVVLAKAPDRSSPELWKRTATGQHIASATLELVAPGAGAPYATYVFKNVTITGFSTHGSGDERQDEVRLAFDPLAAPPNPAFAFDASAPLAPLAEPRVGQMTVDGIPGDIDLVLDAWSVANAGSAQFGPFVVSKAVDGSSPALLSRFAAGAHTKSVTIKLLQPGSATVYSTYVLTDAVLSSFEVLGDARPIERIGFDAAKIESTTPVAGGAPIHACFDRKLLATC